MDIGKQNSPRCEAAKRGYSVCSLGFQKKKKRINTPDVPKNESGLIQMIRMGKSIRHKWVKLRCEILTQYFIFKNQ